MTHRRPAQLLLTLIGVTIAMFVSLLIVPQATPPARASGSGPCTGVVIPCIAPTIIGAPGAPGTLQPTEGLARENMSCIYGVAPKAACTGPTGPMTITPSTIHVPILGWRQVEYRFNRSSIFNQHTAKWPGLWSWGAWNTTKIKMREYVRCTSLPNSYTKIRVVLYAGGNNSRKVPLKTLSIYPNCDGKTYEINEGYWDDLIPANARWEDWHAHVAVFENPGGVEPSYEAVKTNVSMSFWMMNNPLPAGVVPPEGDKAQHRSHYRKAA